MNIFHQRNTSLSVLGVEPNEQGASVMTHAEVLKEIYSGPTRNFYVVNLEDDFSVLVREPTEEELDSLGDLVEVHGVSDIIDALRSFEGPTDPGGEIIHKSYIYHKTDDVKLSDYFELRVNMKWRERLHRGGFKYADYIILKDGFLGRDDGSYIGTRRSLAYYAELAGPNSNEPFDAFTKEEANRRRQEDMERAAAERRHVALMRESNERERRASERNQEEEAIARIRGGLVAVKREDQEATDSWRRRPYERRHERHPDEGSEGSEEEDLPVRVKRERAERRMRQWADMASLSLK